MKKLLTIALLCAGLASAQDMASTTPIPGMPLPGMTSLSHDEQSRAYEAQARLAYPAAFYDRALWKSAVDHAFFANQESPSQDGALRLASLYTTTQWWVNAYRLWKAMPAVPAEHRAEAALAARKMAALARERMDDDAAARYAADAAMWR